MNILDNTNLLPRHGEVYYYGCIFEKELADQHFEKLFNTLAWQSDELLMFGKLITTKRKVAWYGDKPFDYTYSRSTKTALPWTTELANLKQIIENKTKTKFNSCLANLYHTGLEGMTWHSDAETELVKGGSIASLSFGAERKFSFKHKTTKQTISIQLEHGSLLVMKGQTQQHWLHQLPPTKTMQTPRINLTFRQMTESF